MVFSNAVLSAAGWLAACYAGLLTTAFVVVVAFIFSGRLYKKTGGATGDTLGAACEIAEVIPAVVLSSVWR